MLPWRLLVKVDGLLCGEFFAVVTTEFVVFFVNDVKLGGYGLGVGDAFGVGTLDEVFHVVGDFSGEFLNDFVVFDGDDGDKGCDKRHLADFVLGEVFVFDFDNSFTSKFGAVEVVANEDFILIILKPEDADDAIDGFGGDMVDDCAVFNGRDDEFFF